MTIKRPQIKAIIFDLGGVVVHSGFKDLINHYCAPCLTPEGKKKIKEMEREFNLGEIDQYDFYEQMREVFNVHLSDKKMHSYIVKHMKTDTELVEFIPKVKKAKVALFSNALGHITIEVLRKRNIHVKNLFDKVFLSDKIHLVKPDPKAYKYILENLGVEPHEALMVDDRAENIKGAKKIGMQGIVYKDAKQFIKALDRYELIH